MDILGIGYLGFRSPNPDAWRTYGPEVLGLELAETPADDPGAVYLRMDDRTHRLAFRPGPEDQIDYIGWEAASRTAYRDALARFAEAGVAVELGGSELAAKRGVREVARFKDPVGYQHEIFYGQAWLPNSFRSGRRGHQGFVCDRAGTGHLVLVTPGPVDEVDKFFVEVMGFKWFGHAFGAMNNCFLRSNMNPRSHTIAYAQAPGRFGLQHIAIPFRSLDDLGATQDIVLQRELQMQMTLGRHTNDPVISFYHFTPSGFPIECIWEEKPWIENQVGFEVNPTALSSWGHKIVGPMMGSTVRKIDKAEAA